MKNFATVFVATLLLAVPVSQASSWIMSEPSEDRYWTAYAGMEWDFVQEEAKDWQQFH